MKKRIVYLLSAALVFTMGTFGIPETVEAAQGTVITKSVVKVHPVNLKGIKKLKSGTVNAVILGDSIAVSQGAFKPYVTGWDSYLNKSLAKKYSNEIEWDNKAASGTLVDYCLERAAEIESETDVVFICVGRNDRNVYTPDQFSKKYTQLIRVIKRKAPKADIFCIVEPPMVSQDESKFLAIRKAIKNVSVKSGVNLLDVWSAFPKNQDELDKLLADGLHPNKKGYKIMSGYMYTGLVEVINTVN